jgi:hypothetical protein
MPCCHGDVLGGAVLADEEVCKRPRGRLYGLAADEERIHFNQAEIPVRQHPYGLPGLELCPRAAFARRGDPLPATASRISFLRAFRQMHGYVPAESEGNGQNSD